MYSGAYGSVGRHKEGRCQRDFVCPHESHLKFPVRKHVLICDEHKDSPANQRLLENFKQRRMKHSTLPTFAKNISISFHATFHCKTPSSGGDIHDKGIYLLQNIFVNNCRLNMFYDNGCSDFIVKKSTIDSLGRSATKISSEPVQLGGVGETLTRSTLGTYNVKLPMYNGRDASLTGICIKSITSTFQHNLIIHFKLVLIIFIYVLFKFERLKITIKRYEHGSFLCVATLQYMHTPKRQENIMLNLSCFFCLTFIIKL